MTEGGPTREEFEALRRRVLELEQRLGPRPPPPPPAPAPPASVPWSQLAPAPAVAAAPAPPSPAAPVGLPRPAPAPAPARAPRSAASVESLLGERFAPRIGALLVFLAALFFLGVGIQRGWIGPLVQLGIAAGASVVLLVVAHVLTRQKGYGTYPQVLEATAACVLYATAFVAHALPYYERATNLTELGSGVLMALVALGTVALALWRDARVIVTLGYGLAFLTAAMGVGVLPDLTIAYVALLGTSLAVLVMRKGWWSEALLGTLATGGLFAVFALDPPGPSPWYVVLAALPAAAAFLWLSLRPREAGTTGALPSDGLPGGVAGFTLGWAVLATLPPTQGEAEAVGGALALWCALAAGLALAAGVRKATPGVALSFGVGAVALYLVAPWFLFQSLAEPQLAITLVYAGGALALATAHRAFPSASRPLWSAGLTLAAAAAVKAVLFDDRLVLDGSGVVGGWEAWVTFLLLAPALAALTALAPRDAPGGAATVAFAGGVVFLATWGFALFASPFATTLYLLGVGLALVLLSRSGGAVARAALVAGILVVALAAAKAATFDAHGATPRLEWWLAGIETVLVAASLLALHHARVAPPQSARPMAGVLVGGSAVVLASYVLAYADGAWATVLLGALGVAYLVAGFVRASEDTYRYAGFGLLGFAILRMFLVDLRETDLVVRALVFLVLGAVLLGVGYAYARVRRKATAAAETPPPR